MKRTRSFWERTRLACRFRRLAENKGRHEERTTIPSSNLRPFGEAPNGAREALALPRLSFERVFLGNDNYLLM